MRIIHHSRLFIFPGRGWPLQLDTMAYIFLVLIVRSHELKNTQNWPNSSVIRIEPWTFYGSLTWRMWTTEMRNSACPSAVLCLESLVWYDLDGLQVWWYFPRQALEEDLVKEYHNVVVLCRFGLKAFKLRCMMQQVFRAINFFYFLLLFQFLLHDSPEGKQILEKVCWILTDYIFIYFPH